MTKVVIKVPIDINKYSFIYITDIDTERKLVTHNIYDNGIFYPRAISEYYIIENEFNFIQNQNEYYFDIAWAKQYLIDNERSTEIL